MVNYFDTKSIASRYEKGRPYFHADIILRIQKMLGLTDKLDKALDVACGTGLSTRALLEIARQIYGTDISTEMLNNAYRHEYITYRKASAEEQLFDPDYFDIITVGSGVHWFEIDRFLAEASRILKPTKWLVIYDTFFSGGMSDMDQFKSWYPDTYCEKFPPPGRNNHYDWSDENLGNKNFGLLSEQQCKFEIEFTIEQLVLYLTTQSNITAQIEQGIASYSEAEKWLYEQLRPFFTTEKRIFVFGGWIKYLQKRK